MKRTPFLACILVWCSLASSATAQTKGEIVVPVRIHVAQAADENITSVHIEVQNTSTGTIIVDRNGLLEADFNASKPLPSNADGSVKGLHTGTSHFSIGGRWSVDQLRRREPQRVITILPGKTFTLDTNAASLLKGIDAEFQRGEIEVQFTFHDFLLAVDGESSSPDLFKAKVKADQIKVVWHQP